MPKFFDRIDGWDKFQAQFKEPRLSNYSVGQIKNLHRINFANRIDG